MRAFVFPGQGSQAVGMGKALAEAYPAARAVFEEIDDTLGQKLSHLMFEGPEDELRLTANAQPALLAVSMAVLRVLETEAKLDLSKTAAYVAGHSLGEYSALAAARSFDLATAARLLRRRGDAMQKAVPVGIGAMAALLGVELADAQAIAKDASQGGELCQSANDNAPGQVVISGHATAVDRALALAAERGFKRSVKLPVSAPFHCTLMQPAADAMAEALAAAAIRAPIVPLVANVTAQAEADPDRIRQLLVDQVTGMVRWRESILYLQGKGVTELVEIGQGNVLTGLTKRITKDIAGRAVGTPADIDQLAKDLGL